MPASTITLVGQWLGVLALILTIGNTVWLWVQRPAADLKKALGEKDEELEERCNRHRAELLEHNTRIERLENEFRHLPTKEDLHAVVVEVGSLKTELHGVSRMVQRIDDFLRSTK